MQSRISLRLLISLGLLCGAISMSAPIAATRSSTPNEEPRAIALAAWQNHLEAIGWPRDMRNRFAPRFLGKQIQDDSNASGGRTVTFDGSRPGLLATVTIVLDASGTLVGKPNLELADVVEAR